MATGKSSKSLEIEYGRGIGIPHGSTISFQRAHTKAPTIVIAQNAYNADRIVSAYDVSKTGFKVIVESISGAASTSWIDWVAIW